MEREGRPSQRNKGDFCIRRGCVMVWCLWLIEILNDHSVYLFQMMTRDHVTSDKFHLPLMLHERRRADDSVHRIESGYCAVAKKGAKVPLKFSLTQTLKTVNLKN